MLLKTRKKRVRSKHPIAGAGLTPATAATAATANAVSAAATATTTAVGTNASAGAGSSVANGHNNNSSSSSSHPLKAATSANGAGAGAGAGAGPQSFRVILVQTLDRAESLIVMDCEGVALSRDGRLCLLQIATYSTNTIYLFDIVAGGAAFFQAGLKAILESKTIKKIIHDCRQDADALNAQFQVSLNGVFDTQVCFSVLMETRGYSALPIGLNKLLQKYLGENFQNSLKDAFKEEMRKNDRLWERRPLTREMIEYAASDVSYLLSAYGQLRLAARELGLEESVLARSESYSRQYREHPNGARHFQQIFNNKLSELKQSSSARASPAMKPATATATATAIDGTTSVTERRPSLLSLTAAAAAAAASNKVSAPGSPSVDSATAVGSTIPAVEAALPKSAVRPAATANASGHDSDDDSDGLLVARIAMGVTPDRPTVRASADASGSTSAPGAAAPAPALWSWSSRNDHDESEALARAFPESADAVAKAQAVAQAQTTAASEPAAATTAASSSAASGAAAATAAAASPSTAGDLSSRDVSPATVHGDGTDGDSAEDELELVHDSSLPNFGERASLDTIFQTIVALLQPTVNGTAAAATSTTSESEDAKSASAASAAASATATATAAASAESAAAPTDTAAAAASSSSGDAIAPKITVPPINTSASATAGPPPINRPKSVGYAPPLSTLDTEQIRQQLRAVFVHKETSDESATAAATATATTTATAASATTCTATATAAASSASKAGSAATSPPPTADDMYRPLLPATSSPALTSSPPATGSLPAASGSTAAAVAGAKPTPVSAWTFTPSAALVAARAAAAAGATSSPPSQSPPTRSPGTTSPPVAHPTATDNSTLLRMLAQPKRLVFVPNPSTLQTVSPPTSNNPHIASAVAAAIAAATSGGAISPPPSSSSKLVAASHNKSLLLHASAASNAAAGTVSPPGARPGLNRPTSNPLPYRNSNAALFGAAGSAAGSPAMSPSPASPASPAPGQLQSGPYGQYGAGQSGQSGVVVSSNNLEVPVAGQPQPPHVTVPAPGAQRNSLSSGNTVFMFGQTSSASASSALPMQYGTGKPVGSSGGTVSYVPGTTTVLKPGAKSSSTGASINTSPMAGAMPVLHPTTTMVMNLAPGQPPPVTIPGTDTLAMIPTLPGPAIVPPPKLLDMAPALPGPAILPPPAPQAATLYNPPPHQPPSVLHTMSHTARQFQPSKRGSGGSASSLGIPPQHPTAMGSTNSAQSGGGSGGPAIVSPLYFQPAGAAPVLGATAQRRGTTGGPLTAAQQQLVMMSTGSVVGGQFVPTNHRFISPPQSPDTLSPDTLGPLRAPHSPPPFSSLSPGGGSPSTLSPSGASRSLSLSSSVSSSVLSSNSSVSAASSTSSYLQQQQQQNASPYARFGGPNLPASSYAPGQSNQPFSSSQAHMYERPPHAGTINHNQSILEFTQSLSSTSTAGSTSSGNNSGIPRPNPAASSSPSVAALAASFNRASSMPVTNKTPYNTPYPSQHHASSAAATPHGQPPQQYSASAQSTLSPDQQHKYALALQQQQQQQRMMQHHQHQMQQQQMQQQMSGGGGGGTSAMATPNKSRLLAGSNNQQNMNYSTNQSAGGGFGGFVDSPGSSPPASTFAPIRTRAFGAAVSPPGGTTPQKIISPPTSNDRRSASSLTAALTFQPQTQSHHPPQHASHQSSGGGGGTILMGGGASSLASMFSIVAPQPQAQPATHQPAIGFGAFAGQSPSISPTPLSSGAAVGGGGGGGGGGVLVTPPNSNISARLFQMAPTGGAIIHDTSGPAPQPYVPSPNNKRNSWNGGGTGTGTGTTATATGSSAISALNSTPPPATPAAVGVQPRGSNSSLSSLWGVPSGSGSNKTSPAGGGGK